MWIKPYMQKKQLNCNNNVKLCVNKTTDCNLKSDGALEVVTLVSGSKAKKSDECNENW